MSDKLWVPHSTAIPEVEVDGDYVTIKEDRTLPIGKHNAPSINWRQLLMAMARMSRDGMTREAIRKSLDVSYYTDPSTGVRHYISDAVFDRALATGRAMLDEAIKAGIEPAESVTEKRVPRDFVEDG